MSGWLLVLESKHLLYIVGKFIDFVAVTVLVWTNRKKYSTKDQRSSEKAKWERLAEIVDFVKSISDIPVIVNGDVYQYADIEKAKKITRKVCTIFFSEKKKQRY